MDLSSKDFHHPYQAYKIQHDLMKAIYDCVTAGQVGIFESPTGSHSRKLSMTFGSPSSNICDQVLYVISHDSSLFLLCLCLSISVLRFLLLCIARPGFVTLHSRPYFSMTKNRAISLISDRENR